VRRKNYPAQSDAAEKIRAERRILEYSVGQVPLLTSGIAGELYWVLKRLCKRCELGLVTVEKAPWIVKPRL